MVNSTDSGLLVRAQTTVTPKPGAVTDPIIGSFLVNLRKQGVEAQVYVSLDNAYMIFTEVDSRADSTLDPVYRAEAITQREVLQKAGYGHVPIIFGHGNKALGGDEVKEEFLSRANFQRIK